MINNVLKSQALAGNLPKAYFSKSRQIYIRDNIEIFSFLDWYKPDNFVFGSDRAYRCVDNHKLVVSRGKCYAHDFGTGESFNFYVFCQKFLGLRFYAALYLGNEFLKSDISEYSLNNLHSVMNTTVEQIESDIQDSLYMVDRSLTNIYAYFSNVRGIDRRVIYDLFDSNLLYIEKKNNFYNACFPMFNDSGAVAGFEKVGLLSNVKFKSCVVAEQNSYFSYEHFYIRNGQAPDLLFFESVIDLLSFASLIKQQKIFNVPSCVLISLRGLNPEIVKSAQVRYGTSVENSFCFCDSDAAGRSFANNNRSFLSSTTNPQDYLEEEKVKDWNELINTDSVKSLNYDYYDLVETVAW